MPTGLGLRPGAKAPDEPPTPYRLRASPRLYPAPRDESFTHGSTSFAPVWRQVSARPDLAAVDALLLVVDTVNTRPGTSGVLTVGAVRESRPVDLPPFPQGAGSPVRSEP